MILENKILNEKYNVNSVHSSKEIKSLAQNFKNNIKLIVAKKNSILLAGGIIFIVESVMHLQYFGATEIGRKLGASDLIIQYCLDLCRKNNIKVFDFGISSENNC